MAARIVKRHRITITLDINQIDTDDTPTNWFWPGVLQQATAIFSERKAEFVEVIDTRDLLPLMD